MKSHSSVNRGELLVSLGLLALGVYVLVQIQSLGTAQGYEQIGPRLFPYIVGTGLVVFGAILSWHALSGGWRNVPMDQEGHNNPDWLAFGIIGAALILHMALIGSIGFTIASTLLFALVARGFGSRQWLRNLGIGAVVGAATYYLFTLALGLHLPASPLGVI